MSWNREFELHRRDEFQIQRLKQISSNAIFLSHLETDVHENDQSDVNSTLNSLQSLNQTFLLLRMTMTLLTDSISAIQKLLRVVECFEVRVLKEVKVLNRSDSDVLVKIVRLMIRHLLEMSQDIIVFQFHRDAVNISRHDSRECLRSN